MSAYQPKYAPRAHAQCTCTACQKAVEYRKAYYQANKAKILDYAHKYQKTNKQALAAYMKAYRGRENV